MTRRVLPFIAAICLAAAPSSPAAAQTLTLRMAAYVPANSPWDVGLKRLAAEFDRISEGKVRIVFPQSLKVADEEGIIQKMNLGVDGALFSTIGISDLYPDSLALSMPSLIRNDAEFEAVLSAVEPLIRAKLGERYVVLALGRGGWVRYFSRRPVAYPEDLAGMRMFVTPNEDKIIRLLQSVGAFPVKGDLSSLLLMLNSNAVDSFYMSPVFVASLWSQYKGKIGYMSPFKVSPFIGAVIFNKSSWEKVPADLRPRLEEAAQSISKRMSEESAKLEDEAIASMLKDGLKTSVYPRDADDRWNKVYWERRNSLIASMFSTDILDVIDKALSRTRSAK